MRQLGFLLGSMKAVALTALLASAPTALAAVWTNVNPGGGGAFTSVAGGPTGILLVGSDISGAYRSGDHGVTWTSVGYLGAGLEKGYVGAVAFDPGDAGIAYLGVEGGLYLSSDSAKTFSPRSSGGFWNAVAVAPSDPSTVYAARQSSFDTVDPQIYRSTDRGLTWQLVGSLPLGTRVLKLAVRPNSPAQLFALSGYEKMTTGGRRALYVSSDGGGSWTDAHGDSTNQGMTGNPWDAAYDPAHPDTIFATSVMGSNPDGASSWSGYTWLGSQAGGAWTQLSAHTGAILARAGAPGGPSQVVTVDVGRDGPACTECGVFHSVDAGASWARSDMVGWDVSWMGSISWCYNEPTTGVAKTLGQDLSDPEAIYWVTAQFVWGSDDWGEYFGGLFANAISPGYWKGRGVNNVAPAAISASGGLLYAGFYDIGIWRSLDQGASWQASNDATFTGAWLGRGGNCLTILADPEASYMVWASLGETMDDADLIRSSASGALGSWGAVYGVPHGFISGLSLDPVSPLWNRTLYVTANGDVYKSTDDGHNWNLTLNSDSCYVTAAFGSRVFAGGQKGLWRSLDGGATWVELNPSIFHLAKSSLGLNSAKWRGPHAILIAGETVYVAVYGTDRGLYKSGDDGATWVRVLTDNFAREIQSDIYGTLYFGSSSATNAGGTGTSGATGIQYSTDGGATWTSLTSGLPWPFVWPIAAIAVPGPAVKVIAGSPGTGFWSTLRTGVNVGVESERGSIALRIGGFRPNPAHGRVSVAFTLPGAEPAALEIYDLAGRRILRRDLPGMGPGEHVLPLGPGFRPPPGVYMVRLMQAGRSASAAAVVR